MIPWPMTFSASFSSSASATRPCRRRLGEQCSCRDSEDLANDRQFPKRQLSRDDRHDGRPVDHERDRVSYYVAVRRLYVRWRRRLGITHIGLRPDPRSEIPSLRNMDAGGSASERGYGGRFDDGGEFPPHVRVAVEARRGVLGVGICGCLRARRRKRNLAADRSLGGLVGDRQLRGSRADPLYRPHGRPQAARRSTICSPRRTRPIPRPATAFTARPTAQPRRAKSGTRTNGASPSMVARVDCCLRP